jgi:hypothetical protein
MPVLIALTLLCLASFHLEADESIAKGWEWELVPLLPTLRYLHRYGGFVPIRLIYMIGLRFGWKGYWDLGIVQIRAGADGEVAIGAEDADAASNTDHRNRRAYTL